VIFIVLGRLAVFGLCWLRQNLDVPTLARDHGISRATGYRYLDEVIAVLAAQAPDLHDALRTAITDGVTHLILDGKLLPTDRLGEQSTSVKGEQIDAWYSGKHREPGGNVQALTDPDGLPLWLSEVEPGSTNDITAARAHVLGALYWAYSQLDLPRWPTEATRQRNRRVHLSQTTRRRPGTRHRQLRLQRSAPRPEVSRRTRIRLTDRSLARTPPHHHQPPARSARSPKLRLYSPISSAAASREAAEITSLTA
jgi:hypothetical protein